MLNNEIKQKKQLPVSDEKNDTKKTFNRYIIQENARTLGDVTADNFDIHKATQISENSLVALDAKNSLQSMLAAQILSIHKLQQKSMAYAHAADDFELKKYFTNSAIKLANCFVQQANTLAKLQGVGSLKIIVERVDVHPGGQAIVGNVQNSMGAKDKK
ncbi:MAG: hypothetical protein QM652_09955 [Legionella sp.]|uniref:hypothetical protein n=1 Tax=Legionella sp. TaxID=459 RepID=UPI0039E4E02E